MPDRWLIRDARPPERAALEALQLRASTAHPTYREQLTAHPDAIELPRAQIVAGDVRVAVGDDGTVIGFAVLLGVAGGSCELDGLFVEPDRWRTGAGRALVDDAIGLARARGATQIEVTANPDALDFYRRLGFADAGTAQTRFGPAARMAIRCDR